MQRVPPPPGGSSAPAPGASGARFGPGASAGAPGGMMMFGAPTPLGGVGSVGGVPGAPGGMMMPPGGAPGGMMPGGRMMMPPPMMPGGPMMMPPGGPMMMPPPMMMPGGRPIPGQFRGMAITHATGLSPDLLPLFAPRPPMKWYPPPPKPKKTQRLSGVASVLKELTKSDGELGKTRGEQVDASDDEDGRRKPSGVFAKVSKEARVALRREANERKSRELVAAKVDSYRPKEDPNATSDPYRTLFVGRIAYDVDEAQIKREFEYYGRVSSVVLVRDRDGKSRGYAFVEFEREGDMRAAYREMDGRRIEDRRVIVDVERGRTSRDWLPRRLGGGIGRTRAGGKRDNVEPRGRDRTYDEERERERRDARAAPRSPSRSPPPRGRGRGRTPSPQASSGSEEEGQLEERAPVPPAPPPPPPADDDRRRTRSRTRSRSPSRDRGDRRPRFGGGDAYDGDRRDRSRDRYDDRDRRASKRGRSRSYSRSRSRSYSPRRDKRDRR